MTFLLSGTESFLEYSLDIADDDDDEDLAGMKISEEYLGCCRSWGVGVAQESEATEAA